MASSVRFETVWFMEGQWVCLSIICVGVDECGCCHRHWIVGVNTEALRMFRDVPGIIRVSWGPDRQPRKVEELMFCLVPQGNGR